MIYNTIWNVVAPCKISDQFILTIHRKTVSVISTLFYQAAEL